MRDEEKYHKKNSKLEGTLSHIPFQNSGIKCGNSLYKLKRLVS